ncbi:MAG: T9SS type A sorting domain-containing protein [Chitinophagales bacterium]|nr:T9SS type A sorting domain-containing protein [Chitinophagales bacterium]
MKTKAFVIAKLKTYHLLIVMLLANASLTQAQNISVWPGDANNNGVVDHIDLLYVGKAMGTQGDARDTISILWRDYDVFPWNERHADSTNYAYSDCDGSGFVNDADTLAISANYGLIHGNTTVDSFIVGDSSSPELYLAYASDSVFPGQTLNMLVTLGTPTNQLDSVFGVAFTLVYDTNLIEAGTINAYFQSQWLGSPIDQPLFLYRDRPEAGKLDVAISLKGRSGGLITPNASGYGNIAGISFIIEDNLIGKTANALDFQFDFENIRVMDRDFNETAIQGKRDTLQIITSGIGTKEILKYISVYPNPASHQLNIEAQDVSIHSIKLLNLLGVELMKYTENTSTIDLNNIPRGIYMLYIETEEGNFLKKIWKAE